MILPREVEPTSLSHFATGDDEFYRRNDRSFFIDDRWKKTLSGQEIETVVSNAQVSEVLLGSGRRIVGDRLLRIAH